MGLLASYLKDVKKNLLRNDSNRTFCCHRENSRSTGASLLLIRSQAALFTLHVIKNIFLLYQLKNWHKNAVLTNCHFLKTIFCVTIEPSVMSLLRFFTNSLKDSVFVKC